MEAFISCLHAAARELDDGSFEARTVALRLKPSCTGEFDRSRDVYARSAAAQIFHREDDEVFMRLATGAVLNEREKGRRYGKSV
jgi:hypothetical protein